MRKGNFKLASVASLAIVILTSGWQVTAVAQDAVDVSNQDCAAILESYAADPKSVAKALADACQQAMLVAPGAGSATASADAVDPCAGPNAGDSVRCWGPWPTLQPQAGRGPAPDLKPPDFPILPRPEEVANENPEPPEFPLTPCEAGLPCGYATIVEGTGGTDASANTQFASFDLAPDGSSFVVTGDDIVIESGADLNTFIEPENNGLAERLLAGRATLLGILSGDPSEIQARILREGGDGEIIIAGDFWSHRGGEDGDNSGYFAWGRALNQSEIDTLVSGSGTLTFNGPMSVDPATLAQIELNYGPISSWAGNWENPDWNFSAGGQVADANFVSDASQFSSNVQGGFVQGAVVGAAEGRAITHIIEVVLDGPGLIRDVGLLPEVGPVNDLPLN